MKSALHEAITRAAAEEGLGDVAVELVRSARPEHGDWSSNVALVSARATGRDPRSVAEVLANRLAGADVRHLARVEVAGPGFVNFYLEPGWLADALRDVVAAGTSGYARPGLMTGVRVNVEFVSANPTGPLHAGGGRWAAYGDSLCRVFERCGASAHREYYLNDRGTQMGLFAASLTARRDGQDPPEGGYLGEYVSAWAAEMPDDVDPLQWGYERVLRDVRETLTAMHVDYDTWFSERSLIEGGAVEATLGDLRSRGAAYDADGAVWFRSTAYGDDKDRVLVRSDGEPTYLLPDIAYHRDKFGRGFDLLVDVWGADHHGYVARLKAAVAALGHDPAALEVVLGQLVSLERAGQPVRLSKRSGDIVELRDVLDAVGPDVARFAFLLQSIDSRQRIDIDLLTRESAENPVFYVQYAHARIAALSREAAARGIRRLPVDSVDLSLLRHDREAAVIRSLEDLPDVIEDACRSRAPHKLTTWVRDLAACFHGFYHDCPVLRSDLEPTVMQARLWLVEGTRIGLGIGLDLLGVSAPHAM